jgi:hypothetical protein
MVAFEVRAAWRLEGRWLLAQAALAVGSSLYILGDPFIPVD